MHQQDTAHWFIPLYQTLDLLDASDPHQEKLMLVLIKLQEHLLTMQHQNLRGYKQDTEDLAMAIKSMVKKILSAVDEKEGIQAVEEFEQTVRALPMFQKSYMRMLAKAIACVILAAIGAVLGALIGATIEGALMAAFTLPICGAGGIFGVLSGLVHGSITGWAVGLMAAAALGFTGGLACGVFFIQTKDHVDHIAREAKRLAVNQR